MSRLENLSCTRLQALVCWDCDELLTLDCLLDIEGGTMSSPKQ